MYDDIAEETGYDKLTLRNIRNTTKSIESDRRRLDLSFSHHVEVASLSPEEQEYFLNKTFEENLNVQDFRLKWSYTITERKKPASGQAF